MMITTLPNNLIDINVIRNNPNDRYTYIKLNVNILNSSGKSIVNGIIPFTTLEYLYYNLWELYESNTTIHIPIPMNNTKYKYSIYGGIIQNELFHILLVRDDINGTDETILDIKIDNLELFYFIGELGNIMKLIDEGECYSPS